MQKRGAPPQISGDLPSVARIKPVLQALEELGSRQAQADSDVRANLKTRQQFLNYRERVRANLWQILGGRPADTPLKPRIEGVLHRDGYRIEKIIFESRPAFYVTALAYVPTDREPPFPAVLRPLGHYPGGKATYVYGGNLNEVQPHCIALARKGYFVLTFDPYGQVERGSYFDERSGNNHFIQGAQSILTGMHMGQHYLWDSIRAMDYLVSRAEVDGTRVCLTGTSGGGSQTVYHAALDDRIAVSIPACYVMESHLQIEMLGLHPESVFPGYVQPYGPNNTALVACVAPRPQLIIGARHDTDFPVESMQRVYEEVKQVYRLFDAEDHLAFVVADSQHGYTAPMRQAMYRWSNFWLGVEADDQEAPMLQELPDDLFCVPGGDTALLQGETVFTLNAAWARQLAAVREARRRSALDNPDAYRQAIRDGLQHSLLLALPAPPFSPLEMVQAETPLDRCILIRYEPEPGFQVSVTLNVPKDLAGPCPVVVYCNEEGGWPRPALLSALLKAGIALATVSVRLGHAYTALTFGRTDVGMAVADLLASLSVLAEYPEVDRQRVAFYGEGRKAGLVALMAALLDERVKAVAAAAFEPSLARLIEEPDRRSNLHFLPGALQEYDVADLLAALAPRPQYLIHPAPDVEWAQHFYRASGQPAALSVLPAGKDPSYLQFVNWLGKVLC